MDVIMEWAEVYNYFDSWKLGMAKGMFPWGNLKCKVLRHVGKVT